MPWTYVTNDLTGEETVGNIVLTGEETFYENELQKANHKEFRIEKVI